MTKKQKIGCAFALARMLITSPIWFYLLYKILQSVGASDLTWFLFWVYVPSLFIISTIEAVFTSAFNDEQ